MLAILQSGWAHLGSSSAVLAYGQTGAAFRWQVSWGRTELGFLLQEMSGPLTFPGASSCGLSMWPLQQDCWTFSMVVRSTKAEASRLFKRNALVSPVLLSPFKADDREGQLSLGISWNTSLTCTG